MRLLSWNIHKGIGGRDRRYSLDRIITCIEAENPDLICLQEVDRHVRRSQHHDQPRLLARYFRCHAVFQPTVAVADGGYGNLVLSRWPVVSRHRITLRQGGRKPRGAQLLVIDSPEGPLHLVNTHLSPMLNTLNRPQPLPTTTPQLRPQPSPRQPWCQWHQRFRPKRSWPCAVTTDRA